MRAARAASNQPWRPIGSLRGSGIRLSRSPGSYWSGHAARLPYTTVRTHVSGVAGDPMTAHTPSYSGLALLRARFANKQFWQPLWGGRRLQPAYDVAVVGAGGHGLATAFHLARDHGVKRIAVLEKR